MFMRSLSLRTKVFFLFAAAALLTVGPALVLIAQVVERRVYQRATEELTDASKALDSHWRLRDDLLLTDAQNRSREPGLGAALAERNEDRVGRILNRRPVEDRVVLAADTSTRSVIGPALDSLTLLQPTLDLAQLQGGVYLQTVVTRPEGNGPPLHAALWPVSGDSGVVGIVGVGTPLDSAAARQIREATGAEVALVVGDSIVATTLPPAEAEELRGRSLSEVLERSGGITLAEQPYRYAPRLLPNRGLRTAALLFRPVRQELRIASGISQSMIGIGFAAVVLSLRLAGIVSRIVARPTQALAEAAAHLARGDYNAPLPPAAGDEIGQLTRAFGEMRAAVAEREARLRSAQAELIHREKLAAMGRLVAQLSHEINNPIYNIQNCLEALERRGDPSDPNREFLELAQEELGRMASLTRQLLDQSRPLSDAATPLDLNVVARRVVTLAKPDLEARGIALDLRLDPYLPPVVAHPDAIQQVLANLVANAIDAMPDGGTLRLASAAAKDLVEITVGDTGTGIAEEQLPHIFDAFYTTKPGIRGIGLGLFVSEGIIRGHRGRLEVESRPGQGSRFTIRLPRATLDPNFVDSHVPAGRAPSLV